MLAFSTIRLAKTMPSSPAENAIMTIGEVADYLKVTERTIYRLEGAKQIPAFKVGEVGDFPKQILRCGSEIRTPSRRQPSCE
jgi:excisionase family DNA binding protein